MEQKCRRCQNLGFIGIRDPHHYKFDQVDFCDCEIGNAEKAKWSAKAPKAETVNDRYTRAGIPPLFHGRTLSEWDVNQKHVRAARNLIEYDKIVDPDLIESGIVSSDDSRNSIYLYGDYGSRKTTLGCVILMRKIDQGKNCLYGVCDLVLEELKASKRFTSKESYPEVFRKYGDVDYLFLDEIGYAFQIGVNVDTDNGKSSIDEMTNASLKELTKLIDWRLMYMKPTILSSNLSIDNLRKVTKTNQLVDRLLDRYSIRPIIDDNQRLVNYEVREMMAKNAVKGGKK